MAQFRCGLWGWLANVHSRRGARLCRSHRSSSDRRTTGVSSHHTMTCTDVGGRVTDCAGSSVAVEWSDPEGDDGAPIPARRLRLNLRNWVAVATANGQACAEWATRGDERRNTAAYGHAISLGAFRTVLGVGVDEAGSISWRSRTRRLVNLAARRLVGPSAHRPSGRGPGSGFALERRIAPPSRAGGLMPRRS